MEALFENKFTRNKAMLKEIYGYIYFRRKFSVICIALIILSAIFYTVLSVSNGTFEWLYPAFIVFFLLFRVFYYFRQINAVEKRDAEVYGKEISVEVSVTEEYIQNTASTGAVNKLEYGKVKRVYQTKNFILFHSKANLLYIFSKDGFTKGTKEEFIEFIKSKGIKIKA